MKGSAFIRGRTVECLANAPADGNRGRPAIPVIEGMGLRTKEVSQVQT